MAGRSAVLFPLNPGGVIPPDGLGRVTLPAGQLQVSELARVLQGAHLLADLLPGLPALEVLRYSDAVLLQSTVYSSTSFITGGGLLCPLGCSSHPGLSASQGPPPSAHSLLCSDSETC